MLEETLYSLAFWKYVSIPCVAAFVGWVTNLVAIKLLFYPVEPIGRPPFFGWQGIIPSKAAKMGAITTDTTLSRLGTLEEVFGAMEPERISEHLVATISPRMEEYVDELMLRENLALWELLPTTVKNIVYATARQKLPEAVSEMMREISRHLDEMVDIKDMVVRRLLEDRRIINRIFLECGKKEFRFIIISGLYFGFVFGLVQMGVWFFSQNWWILPLFGVIVGYATNWIALRIVFQPLRPRKIGPFVLQGLFLKRQPEVSAIWTGIVTREVLTVRNLIKAMLYGRKSKRTQEVVRKHIRQVVDEALGITKPVVQLTVGVKEFMHLKESVSEKAMELTSTAFNDPDFNQERAAYVRALMQERMEALPPEEFQYLLRPAFQEEELKLILMGAFLGLLAGMAQLYLVFGGING